MSKIAKFKENIYNFIITKSCYANVIDKDLINDFMETELCLFSIAIAGVFSAQIKKNKAKSYHILHVASAIILMTLYLAINENIKYYESKYGNKNIKNVINQSIIFIYSAISQNIKTMENATESEISLKIEKKVTTFLHDKLLTLTEILAPSKKLKMKKTDIIKYKFEDKNIIEEKYKKLSRIESDEILEYLNNKYGVIGQCSLVFPWIMGMGESNPKTSQIISKLGTSLGILIKLTHDFSNLENDIKNANETSYNFIVNCGIHESFSLYDEHKIKFVEGCMVNGIYNGIIKELVEVLETTYDNCLKNTELELASQYSTRDASIDTKSVGTKSKPSTSG